MEWKDIYNKKNYPRNDIHCQADVLPNEIWYSSVYTKQANSSYVPALRIFLSQYLHS